jgi:predicted nucleic acid-binding protein
MIFVDTWAWVALAVTGDQHHKSAKKEHLSFKKKRRQYVTSNLVLTELITHLYRKQSPEEARSFVNAVLEAVEQGKHRLVELSTQQFNRAWELRQKYQDKPDISFVDFTSMVVMQDLGITDVFTGDSHFLQVNLGFRLHP